MTSLVPDLNWLLASVGMTVAQVDSSRASYALSLKKGPSVLLTIRHEDLWLKCGPALFGEPSELTLEFVVHASVINDRRSRDTMLGELGSLLAARGISPVPSDELIKGADDLEAYFDEWILAERRTSKHIVVANLNRLVNDFKSLAFGVGSQTFDHLVDAVAPAAARRYTRSELEASYKERIKERQALRGR